jgi:hypothetical protein
MTHLCARLAFVGILGSVSAACIDSGDGGSEPAESQVSADLGTFVSKLTWPGGSVDFNSLLTLGSVQTGGVPPYSFTWLRNGVVIAECAAHSSCTIVPPVPGFGDIFTLTAQDAQGSVSTDTTEVIGVCPGGGYFC